MVYVEKLKIPLGLTFDDVLLEPAESYTEPSEADVSSRFSKNIELSIPLVSAAMDTVTESRMAIALARSADDIIERDVLTVNSTATVADVDRLMTAHSISGVPVMEGDVIIGIVSRRDLRGIVLKRGTENVRNVMTENPITVDEDITLDHALGVMYNNKVERLPVTNREQKLLGIITMQDLLEKQPYMGANRDKDGNLCVAAAVGPFDFNRAVLLEEAGVDVLVVDCAHGHNMNVVKAVREIKESVGPDVVAGNIATGKAAEELGDCVDGLKVGIGPGSICTTRIVAGVGVPQIMAIAQVAEVASELEIPVIADGGIRYSGDIAKAIAAGADDGQYSCRN